MVVVQYLDLHLLVYKFFVNEKHAGKGKMFTREQQRGIDETFDNIKSAK